MARVIEQDDVTLRVGALNGGIELRLVASTGPEHRLRLSEVVACELLQRLRALLEPPRLSS
jgi:hypothetical protein